MTSIEKESGYRTYSISLEDYSALNELLSQSVPFQGTSGKYCIHSSLVYPRYKIRAAFQKYNSVNLANQRSIAKNQTYADYIILPVERMKEVLKDAKTNLTLHPNRAVFQYLYSKDLSILGDLMHFYEFCKTATKTPKIIDFNEFAVSLENVKERLTIPNSQFIIDLLHGDTASIRLGMETLTNFDLQKSIVAIMYVISESNIFRIKENDYWISTAFKSFRDRYRQETGFYFESSCSNMVNIYERLVNRENFPSLTLTEQEQLAFRKALYSSMLSYAESRDITLNITEESVVLKFSEHQIIKDSEVEEENKFTEQLDFEEGDTVYTIVDDTN